MKNDECVYCGSPVSYFGGQLCSDCIKFEESRAEEDSYYEDACDEADPYNPNGGFDYADARASYHDPGHFEG